jgi:nucleoside-diphosphate-sugar epimerase/pimeloyl-ACP methyl ester carboxylesterase
MSILITGATGFVGSAFLARLLGSENLGSRKVFAVVRPGKTPSEDRLEGALARAMHAINRSDATPKVLSSQVTILNGNVAEDLLGLDRQALAELANNDVSEIWHIASDLSPEGHDDNVAAAHAVTNLAMRMGIENIKYVSTAYVTGKGETTCDVTADVTDTTDFNNAYEQSKLASEAILRDAATANSWRLSILRPSIIVGARDSKLPAGSTSALYGVIRLLMQKANHMQKDAGASKVTLLCGNGDLNLVYIDRVVDAMLADRVNQPLTAGVRTKFIGGSNVAVQTIVATIKDRLNIKISCVDSADMVPDADKKLNHRLSFFAPYTRAENRKTFTGETLDEADKIYDIDLLNLVEAACNEYRHGALMDTMRMVRLQRASGGPVVGYVNRGFNPDAETVVLVNAYGMPSTALHPLIARLSRQGYNTVTWDCRGLPDRGFDMAGDVNVAMSDHFDDWELLCAVLNVRTMQLIGWSTGAVVASYIAAQAPKRIKKLSLINGSFMHPKAELTLFQKNLKSIMPKVAVSQGIAKVLYNSVFKEDRSAVVRLFTRDIANKAEAAMSVTLPHEKHIVQLLTANPDQVFRYARLIRSFVKENPMNWLSDIRVPTALFTGAADITAHPKGSYDASCAIMGAKLHMAEDATHLALYSDPAFITAITDFASDQGALPVALQKVA